MRRKDCVKIIRNGRRTRWRRPSRGRCMVIVLVAAGAAPPGPARAGIVRLFPAAVVVEEKVRLGDLCELKGFDTASNGSLADLIVGDSPVPGGSRVIHRDLIRSALVAHGTNLAKVTLQGAAQCAVTRPGAKSVAEPPGAPKDARTASSGHRDVRRASPRDAAGNAGAASPVRTLRDAVVEHFRNEAARFEASAEVNFDRTADQLLDLAGPQYQFRVRPRSGGSWGLVQIEVDVLADGRTVQTVPMVVQVSMMRRVAVARRPLNQGATVQAADVDLIPLSFTRPDKLGVTTMPGIIGHRAKRYVAAGTVIDPTVLESVPLVTRGQIVTLTSAAGGVRVVTTAKAMQDGLLHETVAVRPAEHERLELYAMVIGPGAVQIGDETALSVESAGGTATGKLARGDRP